MSRLLDPDRSPAREHVRERQLEIFEKLPGRKSHAGAARRHDEGDDTLGDADLVKTGIAIGCFLLAILVAGAWLILSGLI